METLLMCRGCPEGSSNGRNKPHSYKYMWNSSVHRSKLLNLTPVREYSISNQFKNELYKS